MVRLFVALEIAEDVRARLAERQERLRRTHAHVAWVAPGNLHVSLAFLGNVGRELVPLVSLVLDDCAAACPGFSLSVGGVGWFGSARSPRVLWAGVAAHPAIMRLQEAVAQGLRQLGLKIEDRPFKPHITLGRVRSARGRAELVAAARELADAEAGTVACSRVVLMRSELRPDGAVYSVLHAARFSG
jgi:2'-5' RNA ligase